MAEGRVLALDIGDARTGVAVSDDARRLAVPLTTLRTPDGLVEPVRRLVADEDITVVVVGHPVSLSGSPGPKADEVAGIAAQLREALDVPVELHDERLSSVEAERRLRDAGITGTRARAVVDETAAVIILESFLASTH